MDDVINFHKHSTEEKHYFANLGDIQTSDNLELGSYHQNNNTCGWLVIRQVTLTSRDV